MIGIVNVSRTLRPTGAQTYEVRINRDPVVRFEHVREEGLAKCLRLAADAVEAMQGTPEVGFETEDIDPAMPSTRMTEAEWAESFKWLDEWVDIAAQQCHNKTKGDPK